MSGDSIWIIGASMTKFARYEDQDAVDLASTASLDAMADAGVSIHDMDVLAAGTLFQAEDGIRDSVASRGLGDVYKRQVLTSFSVVHRAAPSVPVPFVSAIVKTGDGTSVRSNVVGLEDPMDAELGMELILTTYSCGTDDDGKECIAFGYEPV